MKVAIIDYGMGNLGSVRRAIAEIGGNPILVEKPKQLASAERMILPGVGSFGDGISDLRRLGWADEIHRQVNELGKPLLGICLGMQLLADRGLEGGEFQGLSLIPGEVVRLDTAGCGLRIPHVGWNSITLTGSPSRLFDGIPNDTDFYFVHSYAFRAVNQADILAYTEYGIPVAAAISHRHVFGTQFHPEKSSRAGLRLLQNFIEYKAC